LRLIYFFFFSVFLLCVNSYSQDTTLGGWFTYEIDDQKRIKFSTLNFNSYGNAKDNAIVFTNIPANSTSNWTHSPNWSVFDFGNNRRWPTYPNWWDKYYNYRGYATLRLDFDWRVQYPKPYMNPGSIAPIIYSVQHNSQTDYYAHIYGERQAEYFLPDSFWQSHDFAWFSISQIPIQDPDSDHFVDYWTSPWKTNYNNSVVGGTQHRFDIFIFPYIDENGVKRTPVNDGPIVKYFGPQIGYQNSRSSFIATAQDKEGDFLIYRWMNVPDNLQVGSQSRYGNDDNDYGALDFKELSEGGKYSPDKPLYQNTSDDDDFYLNPYTGYIDYIHKETRTGFRRSQVAIDQYHDGQLIGTIVNDVPFWSDPTTSDNNFPEITITNTTSPLSSKTSFDYQADTPSNSLPELLLLPRVGIDKKDFLWPRTPFIDTPDNNGAVLFQGINIQEGNTVSLTINYSDPDGDNVTFEMIPVYIDLFSKYPHTLNDNGNGTVNWEWTTPDNLDLETTLNEKTFVFLLYAIDNNGAIPAVPGRTIKPLGITVHKNPSIVISSPDVDTGVTTGDEVITLHVKINGIENEKILAYTDSLSADDFTVENAVIKNLTKTSSSTFTATLSPTSDARIAPVTTKVSLASNTLTIKKLGFNAQTIELSNEMSNEFEWTSNRVKPSVYFKVYNSKGQILDSNQTTNDTYIIASIQTSEATTDFTSGDVTVDISSGLNKTINFTEIDAQNYTYKITPATNSTGTVTLSIANNTFKNSLGVLNESGVVSQTGNANGNTHFTWSVDLLGPTLTISPTHNVNLVSTQISETVYFNFNQDTYFTHSGVSSSLTQLSDEGMAKLESKLNLNISKAFLSNLTVISDTSLSATVNHTGANESVQITIPNTIFTDQFGNPSNAADLFYPINLSFPKLLSFYKMGSKRKSWGPITQINSSAPFTGLLAFVGQSNGDSGYGTNRDGRLFDITLDELELSETVTITSMRYYGLGATVTVGNETFAEQLFEIEITPLQEGVVSFGVPQGVFTNSNGIANIYSKISLDYDITPPTIRFSATNPNGIEIPHNAITSDPYVRVRATASEDIVNFDENDIIFQSGSSNKTGTVSNFTSIDSQTFVFDLYPTQGDGNYQPRIYKYKYEDAVGNENVSISNNYVWRYDNTPPTVNVKAYNGNQLIPNGSFTSLATVILKFTFSESVSTVSNTNLVSLLNTSSDELTFQSASFNSSNNIINAVATSNVGTVTAQLSENLFQDSAQKFNTASEPVYWIYDNSIPGVVISVEQQGVTLENNQYFNSGTLSVTYSISENLGSNYSAYSLSQLNTILGNQLSNGTLSGLTFDGNSTFTAHIADFNDGTISIAFPAGLVYDQSNQENTSASNFDLNYDATPPTASFSLENSNGQLSQNDIVNTSQVTLTITTSEISYGFTQNDLILTNASIDSFEKLDDLNYRLGIVNNSSGPVSITLIANSFSDVASNTNQSETSFGYVYDIIRPTATFASNLVASGGSTGNLKVPFTLTFSESMTLSRNIDQLTEVIQLGLDNGTVANLSKTSSTVISFEVERVNNGLVTLTLDENIFYDPALNGNTAATTYSFSFNSIVQLTAVRMSSDNPLEEDYLITYTYGLSNETHRIAGTRSLLASSTIDYLYVKEGAQITMNFTADAALGQATVTIDGQVYTATQSGTGGTSWYVSHTVASAHGEGLVSFLIEYTDTTGQIQNPIGIPTDGIRYYKDFTAPQLSLKLYQNGEQVGHNTTPIGLVTTTLSITSSEVVYEQLAFSSDRFSSGNIPTYTEGDDLVDFHFSLKSFENLFNNQYHHNLSGTISHSTKIAGFIPLYGNGGNQKTLFPWPSSNLQWVRMPSGLFVDLANNISSADQIENISLYSSYNQIVLTEATFKEKGCASVYELVFTLETGSALHSNGDHIPSTPRFTFNSGVTSNSITQVLPPTQYTFKSSETTQTYSRSGWVKYTRVKYIYEITLNTDKWVRFKIDQSWDIPTGADESQTLFSDGVYLEQPEYTELTLTGSATLCGLGVSSSYTATESGTLNTSGTWTVSDTSIATITSQGILTTVSEGNTTVKYTLPSGCSFAKNIVVQDTTIPTIAANGLVEVCEDTTVSLTSSVADNFIWYKNNLPLSNLTSNTIILDQVSQSGNYSLKLITPCGEVSSNAIEVKIIDKPSASNISVKNE